MHSWGLENSAKSLKGVDSQRKLLAGFSTAVGMPRCTAARMSRADTLAKALPSSTRAASRGGRPLSPSGLEADRSGAGQPWPPGLPRRALLKLLHG
eukprot:9976337-Lingulodinium_polyedra.AAC.1